VDVVSVWLVIEPWVKFGTTGTAIAFVGNKRRYNRINLLILI
tara:strand:- start:281 stop:406 length:126 start_codon:yes stop_codon:yes gene_type:complete